MAVALLGAVENPAKNNTFNYNLYAFNLGRVLLGSTLSTETGFG